MYHDGKVVADLNAKTVPPVEPGSTELMHVDGGDLMKLSGNVILCSRGDDPEQRHIDADIAYLSMWDVALNETQLGSLYSAVNQQMEKVGPLPPRGTPESTALLGNETEAVSTKRPEVQRMSTTGRPCLFPTVYKGEIILDCISSGDASRPTDEICPVADGDWETCEPLSSRANPYSIYADPQSLSETPFPPSFESQLAALQEELSSGGGDGDSSEDYARGTLYSADGRLCQFPLHYGDIQVNNCVSFGGNQFCWTEQGSRADRASVIVGEGTASTSSESGEWAPCAAETLLQPPEPGTLGVGPSTVPVLQLQKVVRVTTDGEVCNFPMVVDGEIFDDCMQRGDNSGEPACLGSSGEWKTCNLKDASPEYVYSTTTGSSTRGSTHGSTNMPVYVAERTTVTGKKCIFPAAAGKYVWFDCAVVSAAGGVEQGGSVASGGGGAGAGEQKVCPTADATWELCAPTTNATGFTTKALE
jgi:hypothetical protein